MVDGPGTPAEFSTPDGAGASGIPGGPGCAATGTGTMGAVVGGKVSGRVRPMKPDSGRRCGRRGRGSRGHARVDICSRSTEHRVIVTRSDFGRCDDHAPAPLRNPPLAPQQRVRGERDNRADHPRSSGQQPAGSEDSRDRPACIVLVPGARAGPGPEFSEMFRSDSRLTVFRMARACSR